MGVSSALCQKNRLGWIEILTDWIEPRDDQIKRQQSRRQQNQNINTKQESNPEAESWN